MADGKLMNDAELSAVTGGECDADKYKKDMGSVSENPLTQEITYIDKTGNVGKYTKAQWNQLKTNWAYTGNPDLYIKTVNVNELNQML